MPIIKEVKDSSPEAAPTVKEMRKSQADGSKGIGLAENSFLDDLRDNNMTPSINGEFFPENNTLRSHYALFQTVQNCN